jgi:hypothetical protein
MKKKEDQKEQLWVRGCMWPEKKIKLNQCKGSGKQEEISEGGGTG